MPPNRQSTGQDYRLVFTGPTHTENTFKSIIHASFQKQNIIIIHRYGMLQSVDLHQLNNNIGMIMYITTATTIKQNCRYLLCSVNIPAFISMVLCSLLELNDRANICDSSRQSKRTNSWPELRYRNMPFSEFSGTGGAALEETICGETTWSQF